MKNSGKILGIDLGTKKTGLSYSDESQTLAFTWKTIEGGLPKQLEELMDIIIEEPFIEVVFGLPSKEGEWKSKIQAFAIKLKSAIQEEKTIKGKIDTTLIAFQDEDYTSFQANQNLASIKANMKKKKRHQMDLSKDDTEAARIMLQAYLDKKISSTTF